MAEKHTIREVLYHFLSENCETVTTWYQPFFSYEDAAQVLGYDSLKEIEKPYGVILIGEETQSADTKIGYGVPVEIWPYFQPGDFVYVDEAQRELSSLIGNKMIQVDASHYIINYNGSGRDYHDEDLDAITRRLDFTMPRIRS